MRWLSFFCLCALDTWVDVIRSRILECLLNMMNTMNRVMRLWYSQLKILLFFKVFQIKKRHSEPTPVSTASIMVRPTVATSVPRYRDSNPTSEYRNIRRRTQSTPEEAPSDAATIRTTNNRRWTNQTTTLTSSSIRRRSLRNVSCPLPDIDRLDNESHGNDLNSDFNLYVLRFRVWHWTHPLLFWVWRETLPVVSVEMILWGLQKFALPWLASFGHDLLCSYPVFLGRRAVFRIS